MHAEIGFSAAVVTIGDEVVEGRVDNTNAVWLADRLMSRGVWPRLVVAVPDDQALIVRQLRIAVDSADIVVVSGGMGWTPDDVTRRAVAEAFYRDLRVDEPRARRLRTMAPWADDPISRAACTFPEGAVPIDSPLGGVPGFVLRTVFVLPGAPAEMHAMFELLELPGTPDSIYSDSVSCQLDEHQVTDVLAQFDRVHAGVRLGSYPDLQECPHRLTLTMTSRDAGALAAAVAWIRGALDARQ